MAALTRPGRRLVLGSASPARKAVLAELGVPFSTAAADLDERALGAAARARGDAQALVLDLAAAKGDALVAALDADAGGDGSPALVISADQVVLGGGPPREIREKPGSDAEAAAWIAGYADHPPSTVSGLAVTAWPSRARATGVHEATVVFRDVPTGAALDAAAAAAAGCAGALKIEGPASSHIARIEGGRDSVFGLPVQLLLDLAARVDEEEEELRRRQEA
jgi:septum formation protein